MLCRIREIIKIKNDLSLPGFRQNTFGQTQMREVESNVEYAKI